MELGYSAPRGIPLSILRGRVPVDGEPYWLDDDRRWVLAWQFNEQSKLPCGCYPEDTTGPENDDRFVASPQVCHRHKAIGDAAEHRAKSAGPADAQHGVLWLTEKVDY